MFYTLVRNEGVVITFKNNEIFEVFDEIEKFMKRIKSKYLYGNESEITRTLGFVHSKETFVSLNVERFISESFNNLCKTCDIGSEYELKISHGDADSEGLLTLGLVAKSS